MTVEGNAHYFISQDNRKMLPIVIRPASDRILLSEVSNGELVSPD